MDRGVFLCDLPRSKLRGFLQRKVYYGAEPPTPLGHILAGFHEEFSDNSMSAFAIDE